jgi:hypothetical protein
MNEERDSKLVGRSRRKIQLELKTMETVAGKGAAS